MVRLLIEAKVDPKRLSAVSLAEHHPVAPNDTAANRALNRRIELRLLPVSTADVDADLSEVAASGSATPSDPAATDSGVSSDP